MAILDSYNIFDDGVAITTTRDSTNVIDLKAGADYGVDGENNPVKLFVYGDKAWTSGGTPTLTVSIQGAPDSSGSPGTYTEYASVTLTLAELVANYVLWQIDLPRRHAGAAVPRFLKLVYTVASGPFTGGKVTAGLGLGVDANHAYPPGVSTTSI